MNPFYVVDPTPQAVVHEPSLVQSQLKETFVYDLATEAGKVYSFINK
jgi:hypothetical protein